MQFRERAHRGVKCMKNWRYFTIEVISIVFRYAHPNFIGGRGSQPSPLCGGRVRLSGVNYRGGNGRIPARDVDAADEDSYDARRVLTR